jgi:hypothetical protein
MAWGQVGNIRGPQGEPGTGVQFKGTVNEAAELPNTGQSLGDMYVDLSTGHAVIWNGSTWQDAGQWLGDEGPPGQAGARGSMWFVGSSAPGTISGEAVGDMYLNTATGDVYRLN